MSIETTVHLGYGDVKATLHTTTQHNHYWMRLHYKNADWIVIHAGKSRKQAQALVDAFNAIDIALPRDEDDIVPHVVPSEDDEIP